MALLVRYNPKQTLIHVLDPRVKIIWMCVVVYAALIFTHPLYTGLVFLWTLVVSIVGKVQILKELKERKLFVVSFAIFVILGNALLGPNPAYVDVELYPNLFQWNWITLNYGGLLFGISMFFRYLAMLFAIIVLMTTTQPTRMLHTLLKCKLPYVLVFMLTALLRFVPLALEDMEKVVAAQKARGYEMEQMNQIKKIISYKPLLTPLILNSLRTVNQMSLVIETRGLDLFTHKHVSLREYQLGSHDYAFITFCVCVIIIATLLAWMRYGVL